MKPLFNFLLFVLTTALLISCNTTEPPIITPPPPPVVKDTLTVSVESFTHRSVTLNVQSTINSLQSTIKVFRSFNNIQTVFAEYPILVKDTTIIDDDNGTGLLLDTTYTYFAIRVDSLGQLKDTSNIVTQKTLAPTSHNYTWQEFTIGDWQSALYDVWGTDENNVYACGGVTINDTVYGILHWDGIEWKPVSKADGVAIFGFSNSDIWTVGGAIFHFNGTDWRDLTNANQVFHDNQPYTSIWGTSSNNLYLGNQWGKIIYWDGNRASVVYENSNSIPIRDIYGIDENFILAAGSSGVPPGIVLKYDGLSWNPVEGLEFNPYLRYNAVYAVTKGEYYAGGSKTFYYFAGNWSLVIPYPEVLAIRGDKISGEVVAVGVTNTLMHYNGLDWYNYSDMISTDITEIAGIYINSGKIFAVGTNGTQAKIFLGTKSGGLR